MKRFFIQISILLAVASQSIPSFLQISRFGLSMNSLTTNLNYGESNEEPQTHKQGFKGLQAGFTYQARVGSGFPIVPELYFALKGGVLKGGNPLTTNKSTLRLSSLEAPLLARVHFDNLYLNAGPYAAYTLGGRLKTEGSETLPESSMKISFGNAPGDFQRWDYGVQAGAGYDFNLMKSTLTLDVPYGHGLVNISMDVGRHNRMLTISLNISRP